MAALVFNEIKISNISHAVQGDIIYCLFSIIGPIKSFVVYEPNVMLSSQQTNTWEVLLSYPSENHVWAATRLSGIELVDRRLLVTPISYDDNNQVKSPQTSIIDRILKTSHTLYLANLPFDITELDLSHLFFKKSLGKIIFARVFSGFPTAKHATEALSIPRYAIIEMENRKTAHRVMSLFNSIDDMDNEDTDKNDNLFSSYSPVCWFSKDIYFDRNDVVDEHWPINNDEYTSVNIRQPTQPHILNVAKTAISSSNPLYAGLPEEALKRKMLQLVVSKPASNSMSPLKREYSPSLSHSRLPSSKRSRSPSSRRSRSPSLRNSSSYLPTSICNLKRDSDPSSKYSRSSTDHKELSIDRKNCISPKRDYHRSYDIETVTSYNSIKRKDGFIKKEYSSTNKECNAARGEHNLIKKENLSSSSKVLKNENDRRHLEDFNDYDHTYYHQESDKNNNHKQFDPNMKNTFFGKPTHSANRFRSYEKEHSEGFEFMNNYKKPYIPKKEDNYCTNYNSTHIKSEKIFINSGNTVERKHPKLYPENDPPRSSKSNHRVLSKVREECHRRQLRSLSPPNQPKREEGDELTLVNRKDDQ